MTEQKTDPVQGFQIRNYDPESEFVTIDASARRLPGKLQKSSPAVQK